MSPAAADEDWMERALAAAEGVRGRTTPNPWVGAVVVAGAEGDDWFEGATSPPGGPHAEVSALRRAGPAAEGATLYVTLEPCAHHGRTPPCTEAIVAAGIRVVVAVEDPDPQVSGRGVAALRAAGLTVEVGVGEEEASAQLAPYLKHRRTGRPWVVLKLAASLDGRTAAPDGTSRWITGAAARLDAHRLRSRSDAVLVGAGTVRADDPALTVRLPPGDPLARGEADQPVRVVLGRAPAGAAVLPALELEGEPGAVLDELGRHGILQLLVEGGATVAHAFHQAGVVDRYVLYLAPALFGGDDARPLFAGPGAPSIDDAWRGRLLSVTTLDGDLRIDLSASGR
jgi:diaminohydroxyphosphoribosylaminopyrimidine deaminase/5-amino-6-(5-phosphoribosylamino)uracil reductase